MLSLDLFNSKFEQSLQEGSNPIAEIEMTPPREPEPVPDPRTAPDTTTRTLAAVKFQEIVKAFKLQQPIVTLEWPGKPAVTLTRNQMYSVLKQIINKPTQVQNRWIPILGSRDEFVNKLGSIKIEKAPKVRMPSEPGQQRLDLDEAEKKSSEEPKFKSTRLDRLKTQARTRYPAAASDMEALAADFVDQQDQDQEEFRRVKGVNRRQDELLQQITALNQAQDQEIDSLEGEEQRLQQNIQQLQAANAELAKKLAAMSGRRAKEPTAPAAEPATLGVSVATDKQAEPAYTPLDIGARQKLADLQKQIEQERTMAALRGREPEQDPRVEKLEQEYEKLQAQLSKMTRAQSVMKTAPKKVRAKKEKEPARPTADQMRGEIEPTGIFSVDQTMGDIFGRLGATVQEVHDIPFGMTEDGVRSIPAKMVIQGYTVEYEPVRRMVTVSRGGRVVGRALNKPGTYNNYQVVANRIIDASEEDKYPDDLEARSVERPFGESTEELSAQDILFRTAAKAMYDANREGVDIDYEEAIRIASRLMNIPYAPSMLPALQQQLADVEKKIATLKSVRKSQRQREKEKLTHQTTADEQRRAEEWMKNYGQSLQRRLQTRQTESANEKKSSTAYQEGGRAAYYGRANANPHKPGTKEHADYNRGYQDFKDEGKDYLRELEVDRSGQPMYQAQDVYMLTHNGREIAFYKLKDLKRAEQDAREMQRKLGGEVHLRKVMRETDQQPSDDILKNLFKDFEQIFGKQPQQPAPKEPEKKEIKEVGRAGYNPLTSEKHWHEVEQYLFDLINNRSLDDATREEAKQRYLEKKREAQLKGWVKK